MPDKYGSLVIPVPTDLPAFPPDQGLGDPLLGYVASFVAAVMRTYAGDAWTAAYPGRPVVKKIIVNDPTDAFNEEWLPALYVFRPGHETREAVERFEQVAEDYRFQKSRLELRWILNPAPQANQRSRNQMIDAIRKVIDKALFIGRDPAWIVLGDTDPKAATQGSSLATWSGAATILLDHAAPGTYTHKMMLPAPDRHYDELKMGLAVEELLELDPGTDNEAIDITYIIPGIDSIEPALGPTSGGTSITIHGSGFSNITSVTIGGEPLGSMLVVDDNTITGTVPELTRGSFDLVVGSSMVVIGAFTTYSTPHVVSVSPATDYVVGGHAITITGTGFLDATSATIGGAAITSFVVVSDTTITGIVPSSDDPGEVDVVVTTPVDSSTLIDGFTYEAQPTTLFAADFSALSLGGMSAASFLTATGLVFTRTTASTVQTSSATVDTTPGVDAACIGDAGFGRGLVLQPLTLNFIGGSGVDAPRNLGNGFWTGGAGTATMTLNALAGPDGQTKAAHIVATGAQYTNYRQQGNASQPYTFSCWTRGTTQLGWNNAAVDTGLAKAGGTAGVWSRVSLATGTTAVGIGGGAIVVCDGRNFSSVGGVAASSKDCYIDLIQIEVGDFPTEIIPTGGLTGGPCRASDLLSHPNISQLIDTGRVNFYVKFIPKFDSSQTVYHTTAFTFGSSQTALSYFYLWELDSNNYLRINASTRNVEAAVGGVTYTSTSQLSWTRGNIVEIAVGVGGSRATSAKYRIGATGSYTSLGAGSSLGSISSSLALPVMRQRTGLGASTDQYYTMPVWLQSIAFLTDAGMP